MKVIRVEFGKDRLLSMPEPEYTFFLSLGHVYNEINTATKMLYWSAYPESSNEAEEHGNFAMMLYFTRLLAGHLNEAWEFLQKSFFGSSLSRDYESLLDKESADELQNIKRYFSSSTNSCNQIRNHFAFHFSAKDIGGILQDVDDKLFAYLERGSAPNNLFYCSEVLIEKALLTLLSNSSKQYTFDQLISELFDVSLWFSHIADGLMDAIIRRNEKELRISNPEDVSFDELERFKSFHIPWFTNTNAG